MNNNSIANVAIQQENVSEVLNNVAKRRLIIPIAFALIIIFFFFSFVDFKCNNVEVTSLSGINLVTGTHIKTASDNLLNDNSLYDNRSNLQPTQKVGPNFWAIIAFLTAIGGLAAFYKRIKKESLAGTLAGAIGFVSLLLLHAAIKNKVSEQAGGIVPIEINFLFAYWASLLLFLSAGALSYLRLKQEKSEEAIPEKSSVSKPVTPLHVNIIMQDKTSGTE